MKKLYKLSATIVLLILLVVLSVRYYKKYILKKKRKLLVSYIEKRDINSIKKAFSKDRFMDFDFEYKKARTPLILSIIQGSDIITKYLISKGVDVNFKQPLIFSIRFKKYEIVKILINRGANINCICDGGGSGYYTPLITAVNEGNYKIIKLLLSYNIESNKSPNKYVINKLFIFISDKENILRKNKEGYMNCLKLLIKKGFKCDYYYNLSYPLNDACRLNWVDAVRLILKAGCEPNRNFSISPVENALDIAIKNKNENLIKLLRKYGAKTSGELIKSATRSKAGK